MPETELIELYIQANDSFSSMVMNFVSILSGYLLATYFLGSKITRAQFIILTSTYVAMMVFIIQGIYQRMKEVGYITEKISSLQTDWWVAFPSYTVSQLIILGAHVLVLAGSVYFGLTAMRRKES